MNQHKLFNFCLLVLLASILCTGCAALKTLGVRNRDASKTQGEDIAAATENVAGATKDENFISRQEYEEAIEKIKQEAAQAIAAAKAEADAAIAEAQKKAEEAIAASQQLCPTAGPETPTMEQEETQERTVVPPWLRDKNK